MKNKIRDLEFRAWDAKNEVMYPFAYVKPDGEIVASMNRECKGASYFSQDEGRIILMQYTGLKDRNGVKIFEGDKLRFPKLDYVDESVWSYELDKLVYEPIEESYDVGVVSFKDGTFCIRDFRLWSDGIYDWHSIENIEVMFSEVVGNAYFE